MNIQILDSWLREYLITDASPYELARSLSLCGPSFDRTDKVKINGTTDYLYDIEVTTNRVDMMSVYGIAREALVILPEFGFKTKLKPLLINKAGSKGGLKINLKVDPSLASRVMCAVVEFDMSIRTPEWMVQRLKSSGIRSLNLAVDITNYVMLEVGHPTHVFDYDLVKPSMNLRLAKKGERIISLEDKQYELGEGDIVISNAKNEIIDLPGIIGTKNSIVNSKTKRILFFLETNDPTHIRKTSLRLGIRTNAAVLNEKGVNLALAETAMYQGISLFKKLAQATVVSKVYDVCAPGAKTKPRTISVDHEFIEKILGVEISPSQVIRILKDLGFEIKRTSKSYKVIPPTFRAKDVQIPEDVVEEIARIYGYHKLPSVLMPGVIPQNVNNSPFEFETSIKNVLVGLGANEVYTNSMVAKQMASKKALAVANPLGTDSSTMRTSLRPNLVEAARFNGKFESFHLFEMANVYIPKSGLPDEIMTLAGVIKGKSFRDAKGVIEAMLVKLRVNEKVRVTDAAKFTPGKHLSVGSVGRYGELNNELFYYEFDVEKLRAAQTSLKYTPIPKYPAQIEDITVRIPDGTLVSDVIKQLKSVDKRVANIKYVEKYKKYHTVRIYYQDPQKTLDNKDVEGLRKKLIRKAESMNVGVKE